MKKATLVFSLAALAVVALAPVAVAQNSYIELLRSDIRTQKVALLTEALELTEAEAEAFWPIHRQYETELSSLGDDRLKLMKNYAETFATMTDEQAKGLAKDWFKLQEGQTALLKKYFKKFDKAISSKVAAKFIQIENQIGMLIDLQVAAETPLIQ